ncbi:hypothetical protein D9757_005271 [Collybiopsis confluens]|uniref:F-box domain-containing protein n=1 Tax=Collybiopsis confluens TaxID=2823264 RepID=A0A8H5MDG5_9AGAR|nr:hypothetical protein D9757_005271 [Collybiopsis confluens]
MSRNNQQNLISAYVQRDDSTASAALDVERPIPPDRKLPPELLSLIFHLHTFSQADYAMSVEKARNPTRDIEVEITCTPMQLSWVCSYWRQAILQDHALWASLFISMFELHGDSLSKVIDLFVGFIAQRSGDIPLKIKIQGYYRDGAPQWRLLDKLLFFTARCTHIVLDANDWTRHASRLLRRSHASSLIDNVDGLSLLFESDESAATSIDGQEPQSMAPKTPFPNLT